jgi:antitoxin component of RelBE/YafQ-DinJ toxin-antitoxin module
MVAFARRRVHSLRLERMELLARRMDDRLWEKVDILGEDDCWEWGAGKHKFGYGMFWISGKTVAVHRVIYELVNGALDDGLCVLHECDNPPCCNPRHLFPGTSTDNTADRHSKGRDAKGETHGSRTSPENIRRGSRVSRAKLTEETVFCIREGYARGLKTTYQIGEEYGLTASQIGRILLGKSWRHVEMPKEMPGDAERKAELLRNRRPRGERCGNSKFTEEIVKSVRDMVKSGATLTATSRALGVSLSHVSRICKGKSWSHIPSEENHLASSR